MSQMMMFDETPAMNRGLATLHSCNNCGSILYVTSKGDGTTRKWDSPCPVCLCDDWRRLRRGQGPFQWAGDS
jgi:hypothetical protein